MVRSDQIYLKYSVRPDYILHGPNISWQILSSSLSRLAVSALASGVAPLSELCAITQAWPNLTRLLAQSNVAGPKCPINLLPSRTVASVLSSTCTWSITGLNAPIWIATSRYPLTFTGLLHSPYTLRPSWRTVPISITLGLAPVSRTASTAWVPVFPLMTGLHACWPAYWQLAKAVWKIYPILSGPF